MADGGVVYSVSNCPAWSVRPIALRGALAQLRATVGSELSASTESDAGAADSTPLLSTTALGDDLWALAKNATTLQVNVTTHLRTKEATGALQHLACEFAATVP
jgi:hypothetical protein